MKQGKEEERRGDREREGEGERKKIKSGSQHIYKYNN